jgi:NUDIX domain
MARRVDERQGRVGPSRRTTKARAHRLTGMGKTRESVAKARIVFVREDSEWALLSRKNARHKRNHGLLEMLGGHIESGETPLAGLVRELGEEERTGGLAAHVARSAPESRMKVVDNADHYLFEVRLPFAEFEALDHDPEESLGFELVAMRELINGTRTDELTWRTQRIFEAFGAEPPGGSG